MSTGSDEENVKESLLTSETMPSGKMRWLTKLDFFSFLPVPKDHAVSTKQSICGSLVFIVLFLVYIVIQFTIFVTDNPPKIQSYNSKLDS